MPKNKATGLSMYIEEVLKPEKFALEGKTYKTQHLVAEGHTRYKELTDEERAFYVNMAKDKRLNKKVAIETQSAQQAQKKEQLMSMEWKKAINVHLDKYNTTEELKQHRFHFVGVQYALKTDEGEYRPLEVGMVQWCMLSGIDDSYHTFIDPGTTPLGYAYQVSSHAEESHQIEEERFKDFSNSYDTIWQQLLFFVSVQGVTHPVYCMKRNIAQVEASLDWLAGKAWSGKKIQVLPIEELVIQLFSVLGESSFPLSITLFLKSIRFEHLKNTKCSEHDDVASEHCGIGHAKMMSYLISEALSEMFDFEITQKHIPEEDLGSFSEARVANDRRGKNDSRRINEVDEEEEEEEEDDDDSGDDDNDDDKDCSLMNVNEFKIEFGESSSTSRKNDLTGGLFIGGYNAPPPNRNDHNTVSGVRGGFRTDTNRRGNNGRSLNDESGWDEDRKPWGRVSNPDASMRMMRGGRMNGGRRGGGGGSLDDWDNFNKQLPPFCNQRNNKSLKSNEILITGEIRVAEARTELMSDRWNDGSNAFNYDHYTKNICNNKSFGNSYNNINNNNLNNNNLNFNNDHLKSNQLNNNQYNNYNNNQYYNNQYNNNSSKYDGYIDEGAMPYSTNNNYNGNYNNANSKNCNYNYNDYHNNYNNFNRNNNNIYNQAYKSNMNEMRPNSRYINAHHNRNHRGCY